MQDEDIHYLRNGEMVKLDEQLKVGYLVRYIYEDSNGDLEVSGDPVFVKEVFKIPPTKKISEELIKLYEERNKVVEEIGSLKNEVLQLRKNKTEESRTVAETLKIPGFKKVMDYFLGNYTHEMKPNLEITAKASTSRNVYIEMVKGEIRFGTLSYEQFGSDRRPVTIFDSIAAANAERKSRAIEMIKKIPTTYGLRDLCSNWPKELSEDEDVKFVLLAKTTENEKLEKLSKINSSRKAIEDHKKILTDLGESV